MQAAVTLAVAQQGRPYASSYEPPSSGRFYCSSLVEFAWRQAMEASKVFVLERFELLFVPLEFWTEYYRSMGEKVPVNVTGSNPTLVGHSRIVELSLLT